MRVMLKIAVETRKCQIQQNNSWRAQIEIASPLQSKLANIHKSSTV